MKSNHSIAKEGGDNSPHRPKIELHVFDASPSKDKLKKQNFSARVHDSSNLNIEQNSKDNTSNPPVIKEPPIDK